MELPQSKKLIGELIQDASIFATIDDVIISFETDKFKQLNSIQRSLKVNEELLELIEAEPDNTYLLSEVTHYCDLITEKNILDGSYNLTAFERWLNQDSGLSYEENRRIRGKIVGKYIPREEYQRLFPVGQDKVHPGTHTVTAHNPPDLDSTTASFVSWLDAFACRVGETLTVWNVPQGKPSPIISKLFTDLYSDSLFSRVAKQKTLISHVAMDIVQQDRLIKVPGHVSIRDFSHNKNENHVILVDEEGFYLGDWRVADVDSVGRVQRLLNICMHIYEKDIINEITRLFSNKVVLHNDCKTVMSRLFTRKIPDFSTDFHSFSTDEYHVLDTYLKEVLNVSGGCGASMQEFFTIMDRDAKTQFLDFKRALKEFFNDDLFDNSHCMDIKQHEVFHLFHKAYNILISSTKVLRAYLDRLDIAMKIKQIVLKNSLNYVTTKAEIDEIRKKIQNYRHVTVTFPSRDGRLVPVGVIHDEDVEKPIQGTVSFRDFCNLDEIKLKDHLDVISAVDHHKSSLNSSSAMVLTVADVQSSNILTAEIAFDLNDKYGTAGLTEKTIEDQLKKVTQEEDSEAKLELIECLISRKRALKYQNEKFFINPRREFDEYLLFLNAIVDDTDLLNKCGWRDLKIICDLINRMKSLASRKEIRVIDISDLKQDKRGLRRGIRRVLENDDFYSFYKVIYEQREEAIGDVIVQAGRGEESSFFEDCKVQNQACAISQFKLFPNNWNEMNEVKGTLLQRWFENCGKLKSTRSEVDFFLQMISTIPSAKEAYEGSSIKEKPIRDQIWIMVLQEVDESISRLKQFFMAFNQHKRFNELNIDVEIHGSSQQEQDVFEAIVRDFLHIDEVSHVDNQDLRRPIISLTFTAGSLNSRKADITPFLPK